MTSHRRPIPSCTSAQACHQWLFPPTQPTCGARGRRATYSFSRVPVRRRMLAKLLHWLQQGAHALVLECAQSCRSLRPIVHGGTLRLRPVITPPLTPSCHQISPTLRLHRGLVESPASFDIWDSFPQPTSNARTLLVYTILFSAHHLSPGVQLSIRQVCQLVARPTTQ